MASEAKYDRERDPEVIAKRQRLFKEYIETRLPFIDYLCAKYIVNKNWDTFSEIRSQCLINLYRYLETYDPSKYNGKKKDKNLQNWIHIVCKRLIHSIEEDWWKKENATKDNIDASEMYDIDGICLDTENTEDYITIDNWQDKLSDEVYEAYKNLTPIQQKSLILQYQGYEIDEIRHMLQENSDEISNYAIRKIMQKGRQSLKTSLANDGRETGCGSEQNGGDMHPYNPEDEFKLEVRNPKRSSNNGPV